MVILRRVKHSGKSVATRSLISYFGQKYCNPAGINNTGESIDTIISVDPLDAKQHRKSGAKELG